jgi:phosphate transport system substrate-binding protein
MDSLPVWVGLAILLFAQMGHAIDIQSVGSKSAARIYSILSQAFNLDVPSHRLVYFPHGSSEGTCRMKFVGNTNACSDHLYPQFVDWAAVTDTIYKAVDYAVAPDLQLLPAFAFAVVPIYNIPGVQELNLPKDVLADIFRQCRTDRTCPSGWIEYWNDSRIVEANAHINPELLTAAGKITLIIRADGSGTTEVFKRAMFGFSTGFATQVLVDRTATWTNVSTSGAFSNQGISARVKYTKGAIGYVTMEEATNSQSKIAGIGNSILDGQGILRANQLSAVNAIFEKGLSFGNNNDNKTHMTADVAGAQGSEAWPIMGYVRTPLTPSAVWRKD